MKNTKGKILRHCSQFLFSFPCPNQVFQDPQRSWGTSHLQAPRQGRDGEEGDWAHGLWWAENHLCGFQRLPQQPRAWLGQRERHPIWPDLHLCRWHWRPCKARGTSIFILYKIEHNMNGMFLTGLILFFFHLSLSKKQKISFRNVFDLIKSQIIKVIKFNYQPSDI